MVLLLTVLPFWTFYPSVRAQPDLSFLRFEHDVRDARVGRNPDAAIQVNSDARNIRLTGEEVFRFPCPP